MGPLKLQKLLILFFSAILGLGVAFTSNSNAHAQTTESPQGFALLPLLNYGQEQGFGAGVETAWHKMFESNWAMSNYAFFTTQTAENYIGASLSNRRLWDLLTLDLSANFGKNPRAYFYGIGNESSLSNPLQYGITEHSTTLNVGVRIFWDLIIGAGLSHRAISVGEGIDNSQPQLQNPNGSFSAGTHLTMTRVFASYDTRRPDYTPQEGNYVYVVSERSQPRSGESLSLERISWGAERYWNISDKRLSLLTRFKSEQVWGNDLPFYAVPRLGGSSSLRAFRRGRFTDRSSLIFNFEPRWVFWEINNEWFNRFETSIGTDLGQVYGSRPESQAFHIGYALGLTAVLKTGIPVHFSYATGPEGALIHSHLYYPF